MRRGERSGSALKFQAFIFAESELDRRSQSRHAPVSPPASHTGNFLAARIGHPLLGSCTKGCVKGAGVGAIGDVIKNGWKDGWKGVKRGFGGWVIAGCIVGGIQNSPTPSYMKRAQRWLW
jgi:hypothetical protein